MRRSHYHISTYLRRVYGTIIAIVIYTFFDQSTYFHNVKNYVTLTIKGTTIKLAWLSPILSLKLRLRTITNFHVLRTNVFVELFNARFFTDVRSFDRIANISFLKINATVE